MTEITDKEPVGLTPDEITLLDQALDELPDLLADAALMAGPRRADDTRHAATLPGPRPPLDLTLIDCQQNIDRVYQEIRAQLIDAGKLL